MAAASMIGSGLTAVVAVSAPVHAAAARSSLTPMLPPATANKLELRSNKIKSQLRSTTSTATTSHADQGRRGALVGGLAALLFVTSFSSSGSSNAGVIEEYLEKSKANKELNDRKRLATSGANFARAYTVQFGTCKFPENFTGCQDLAKQKKVEFLSDDLKLECEGKDKYKCGSNVFWKW